ncbi:MAG TPA: GNAT family N-acetyltransferase [Vicinamibacterales bacterium]
MAGQLTIETIRTEDAFLKLEPEWNDLLERAEVHHPFLTFEWIRTWWECFGKGHSLHVVIARDGGTLVAVAPLMRDVVWEYGLRVRRLQLMCNDHTPRLDCLAVDDRAWRAIWTHLHAADSARWDVLQLRQITATSSAGEAMQQMADDAGHLYGSWPASVSPYVSLRGTWDEYLAGRSYQHRKKMRAKLRHLHEEGEVELEIVTGGGKLAGALESGLAIEAAAWKASEGTAIRSHAAVRTFYARFAERAAARGWLELQFLTLDGQRIAFAYDLRYRQKIYRLKIGYDPVHARHSPSQLLCMLSLERAFSEGLTELDFLGEDEPWKRAWATSARPHHWLYICAPCLRSRLFHYAKFRLVPRIKKHSVVSVLGRTASAFSATAH